MQPRHQHLTSEIVNISSWNGFWVRSLDEGLQAVVDNEDQSDNLGDIHRNVPISRSQDMGFESRIRCSLLRYVDLFLVLEIAASGVVRSRL